MSPLLVALPYHTKSPPYPTKSPPKPQSKTPVRAAPAEYESRGDSKQSCPSERRAHFSPVKKEKKPSQKEKSLSEP